MLLGRNAQPIASFNAPEAQRLLPGALNKQWRAADRELFLTPATNAHPLLREFQQLQSSTPWNRFAVFRHWDLDPLAEDAFVIFRMANNNKPAVLERKLGRGRVVTLTTPLSDLSPRGKPWNELAYADNNWPPFLLVDQLGRYLVDSRKSQWNFTLGEPVVLQNDEEEYPEQYQIFTPQDRMQQVRSRDGRIELGALERPGGYYLKGQRGATIVRGFAANLPLPASDLQRLDPALLDERLGKDRYQLASQRDDIHRVQDRQRVGREFFPFLLLTLAAMLALEHLLSNRFYRQTTAPSAGRLSPALLRSTAGDFATQSPSASARRKTTGAAR